MLLDKYVEIGNPTPKPDTQKPPKPENLQNTAKISELPAQQIPPEEKIKKESKLKDITNEQENKKNDENNKFNSHIFQSLFNDVTANLFSEIRQQEYRRFPINVTANMIKPIKNQRIKDSPTGKLPKYANFESLNNLNNTELETKSVDFTVKSTLNQEKILEKIEQTPKTTLKLHRKSQKSNDFNEKIKITLKLKEPFENKALYDYLPLLEINSYDNDPLVKQIKGNIKEIISELEKL